MKQEDFLGKGTLDPLFTDAFLGLPKLSYFWGSESAYQSYLHLRNPELWLHL